MAAAIGNVSRHGLSIDVHHRNQPNNSKNGGYNAYHILISH